MSKLYLSESGRIIPELGEELTTFRRARKCLELPGTGRPATLYCLAHNRPGSSAPLRLAVNGADLPPIPVAEPGDGLSGYRWLQVAVPAELLVAGRNTFDFWSDGTAMDTWALALESGHAEPGSLVSDDCGATWRNYHMSYLSAERGEYAVRVRLAEGEDPPPPPVTWEDPNHPRVAHLRSILPAAALAAGPLLRRVRALSGWLASSWEHTNSGRGTTYAPWDAETILAWGRSRCGHNARVPIAMCVHYGAALVSCCQAAGIPARCVISTNDVNGASGHFIAEVWFEDYGKWVLVDPNLDAIFFRNGVPLSAAEVQAASQALGDLVEWGAGTEYQRGFPHMRKFIAENYIRGVWIEQYSIWSRADFLSHPEFTPPGHGSLAYCETGMVWRTADLEQFGMFPYRAEAEYFEGPPPALPPAAARARRC